MKLKRRTIVSNFEFLLNVVILYISSGAIFQLIYNSSDESNSEPSLVKYSWYLIYGIVIILFRINAREIYNVLNKNWIIVIILFFSLLSISWSNVPYVALRRSISLMLCLIYTMYLCSRFDDESITKLLFYFSCLVALSCFLFILLLPKYGIDSGIHKGAWLGVYFHKNGLGRISGLCLIFSFSYYQLANGINKFISIIIGCLCLLLLVMSKSTTSLVALIVLLPSNIIVKYTYGKLKRINANFLFALIISILIFIAFSLSSNIEKLYGAFGKDDSLSGRLPLWLLLVEKIKESPIYGYGYSSFWIPNVLSNSLWTELSWNPEQGHNGFIDITLELGIIGLILTIILIIRAYIRAITQIIWKKSRHSYWYLLVILFLTIVSFAESFIFKYNNVYWILFLVCFILSDRKLDISKNGTLRKI